VLIVAFALAQAAARCGVQQQNGPRICLGQFEHAGLDVRGPALACSHHFAVKLNQGDRLTSHYVAGFVEHRLSTSTGTIRFSPEQWRSDWPGPLRPTSWRADVFSREHDVPDSVGLPYVITGPSPHRIVFGIESQTLHGDKRDARILARLRGRTADDRCTATMDPYSIDYLLKFNPVK